MTAIVVCLVGVSRSDEVAPKEQAGDLKTIQGLWSGSRASVFFLGEGIYHAEQAVTELVIQGDHVELKGFPGGTRLTGTVRLDPGAKRMHITPAAEANGQPQAKAIDCVYELKADELTLTASQGPGRRGRATVPSRRSRTPRISTRMGRCPGWCLPRSDENRSPMTSASSDV